MPCTLICRLFTFPGVPVMIVSYGLPGLRIYCPWNPLRERYAARVTCIIEHDEKEMSLIVIEDEVSAAVAR